MTAPTEDHLRAAHTLHALSGLYRVNPIAARSEVERDRNRADEQDQRRKEPSDG